MVDIIFCLSSLLSSSVSPIFLTSSRSSSILLFLLRINADPRRKNYPSVIAIDCEVRTPHTLHPTTHTKIDYTMHHITHFKFQHTTPLYSIIPHHSIPQHTLPHDIPHNKPYNNPLSHLFTPRTSFYWQSCTTARLISSQTFFLYRAKTPREHLVCIHLVALFLIPFFLNYAHFDSFFETDVWNDWPSNRGERPLQSDSCVCSEWTRSLWSTYSHAPFPYSSLSALTILTPFYHPLSTLTKVLLDSLVSPTLPITEWRSNIHGIGEDDLQGVRYNRLSSSLVTSSHLTLH